MTNEALQTYDRIVTHGTSADCLIGAFLCEYRQRLKGCDESVLRERLEGVAYAFQRYCNYEYRAAGRRRRYLERPLRQGAED